MDHALDKNLGLLKSHLQNGVTITLTADMLNNSVIDTTKAIRDFFASNDIFNFDELFETGDEQIECQLFDNGEFYHRTITFFLSQTPPSKGDGSQFWISNLARVVDFNDVIYLGYKEETLFIVPVRKTQQFALQVEQAFSAKLGYVVSSGLKNLIGKQLITDDFAAIFELVKNSFDAHATEVSVKFIDLDSSNAKIIIQDDGKGMSFSEIKDKWLFVAYSAKKDGTEDDDYRHELGVKKVFAGAKGVGRFSCDKLGNHLKLTTRKDEPNAATEVLLTDWKKFEEDPKARFEDIGVVHETSGANFFTKGTQLEISGLESGWDRQKLLELKVSLEKLILPQSSAGSQGLIDSKRPSFQIELVAEGEMDADRKIWEAADAENNLKDYYKTVNGPVKNLIFESLDLKTTAIEMIISPDGETITTSLTDRGTDIYKITEKNTYELKDIYFKLYHLNQSAKVTFSRRMGFPIMRYGHVFVYKNGFRIYPFGDFEEDNFAVDIRKSHKEFSRLGTRSLSGRIEIQGSNDEFIESTSRDAGFIQNHAYAELKRCYFDVLTRFERYVVDVIRWGYDLDIQSQDQKEHMLNLIADITGSESMQKLWYNDSLVDILASKQENSAKTLLQNLQKAVLSSGQTEYMRDIQLAQRRLSELEKITEEAEEIAGNARISVVEARKALEFEQQKNKYLIAADRSISDDSRGLIHTVKIITERINTNIDILSAKIKNDELDKEELLERLGTIRFNNEKAYKISRMITKADFKGQQEKRTVEIVDYVEEYVNDYMGLLEDRNVKVEIIRRGEHFFRKISLLDLSIIIDNLIANSEKKGATKIVFDFRTISPTELDWTVSDNGDGLSSAFLGQPEIIFELGITDTDGSGIGLHTVKSVLAENNADINFSGNNMSLSGASFKIIFR